MSLAQWIDLFVSPVAKRSDDTALPSVAGKVQEKAGRLATSLVQTEVTPEARLVYQLNKYKLREVRHREGRYLLRTNLENHAPDTLWRYFVVKFCFL